MSEKFILFFLAEAQRRRVFGRKLVFLIKFLLNLIYINVFIRKRYQITTLRLRAFA
jgi:hypothetical protein